MLKCFFYFFIFFLDYLIIVDIILVGFCNGTYAESF